MNEEIRRAVSILRSSPTLSDDELLRILVEDGIDRVSAACLIRFLPMAYCRLILGASGARFSDTLRRILPDGRISSERLLSSEPLWTAATAFASVELEQGVAAADLLVLAARSAEFDAANQLLNQGSLLKNLAFGPPLLLWPAETSESEGANTV
jgi:hypothetical protein